MILLLSHLAKATRQELQKSAKLLQNGVHLGEHSEFTIFFERGLLSDCA